MKFSNIFRVYVHNGKPHEKIYEVCYKSHIYRRYSYYSLPLTARNFIKYGNHRIVKDEQGNPVRYENCE